MFRKIIITVGLALSLQSFGAESLDILYRDSGVNNTASSFDILALVKDINLIKTKNLYGVVEYAALTKGTEMTLTNPQRVVVGSLPVVKFPFIQMRVDRLLPTTMYRARISLSRLDGKVFTPLYTSPFYYTTTAGPDPKSLVRTRMILKGMKEFSDSEKGFVGANGTVAVDGTRYGATPGELWCSEFYAWVANGSGVKGIVNASSVKKITAFFKAQKAMLSTTISDMEKARRGDYVSLDTDNDGVANHSGMFLALDRDEEAGLFVWTLEGNYGNKIKVVRRPLNGAFIGLGHITNTMF